MPARLLALEALGWDQHGDGLVGAAGVVVGHPGVQDPLGVVERVEAAAGPQLGPQGLVEAFDAPMLSSGCRLLGGCGCSWERGVDLSCDVAIEFPESSSGGEALFAAVLGGVVGGVGVPAGPHDAEPGTTEDPDGVGVVLAAPAGVGIEPGCPG